MTDKSRVRVIGVGASANENGNSATLLREALRGANEAGAETKEVWLPRLRIEYCRGCLHCMREGRCFQEDDMVALRKDLSEADGIILATPTYGGAPCARMKNLVDRLGLFEYMTSAVFSGKYVVTVATAKSFGAKAAAAYLATTAQGGVFGRARVTGRLAAVLRGGKSAADLAPLLSKARRLGEKMVHDLERGRTYPWQKLIPRLFNRLLMRPLIEKGIVAHAEGAMRGVYDSLKSRSLLN
jgi:multimeric flavodoxin WrbA